MNNEAKSTQHVKKAILMCTCSFACPSMKDINFGELSERIRLELPHDYMLLHPRLCEENGENLLADLLKDNVLYVTPACKEEKQKKLLRDGFEKAGVKMDNNWKPVSISFKNTETAFNDIKKALEEV
ncbi:hypothetical protein ABRY23_00795 [Melioribacteraceae bacterium 4301-Me]|uniref:hypothetical protein n=1 Tax=Pyranulibacter aquaticus TaxID=3163344 RepID=UPI003596DC0B